MLSALDGKDIPNYSLELFKDYFKGRVLLCDTDDGKRMYAVSAGVPQDSVLDTILCNVMYDGVLKLKFSKGTRIVGLVDLVIRRKHLVRSWIAVIGLKLADHKTYK